MRFKGLDLNLLIALDVLLEERSVSAAARRMNMTQPAMSAALNRLREYFKDEILVINGRRMMASPYAESLASHAKTVLADVQLMISTSAVFDPLTSDRSFRIAASDYLSIVLITPLVIHLDKVAPNIKIELRFPSSLTTTQLENGEIDLIILPEEYAVPLHPTELLFEETHVLVGWNQNPVFERPIDEDIFFDLKFVATWFGSKIERSFAERRLDTLERSRQIDVYAPSFTTVPWLLVGTNRVAVMHKRLAQTLMNAMPLVSAPLPFVFPPMREMMQFHRTHTLDGGLIWLRAQIAMLAEHQGIEALSAVSKG